MTEDASQAAPEPLDQPEELDDLDLDVEGHGLKEMTVALGAAGVLVGGAGVALAAGPFDGTARSAGVTGATASQEAGDTARHGLDVTERTARTGGEWAGGKATGVRTAHVDPAADLVGGQAASLADHAGTTKAGAGRAAARIAEDPVGWGDGRVDAGLRRAQATTDATRQARDDGMSAARTRSVRVAAQAGSTGERTRERLAERVEVDADGGGADVRVDSPRM